MEDEQYKSWLKNTYYSPHTRERPEKNPTQDLERKPEPQPQPQPNNAPEKIEAKDPTRQEPTAKPEQKTQSEQKIEPAKEAEPSTPSAFGGSLARQAGDMQSAFDTGAWFNARHTNSGIQELSKQLQGIHSTLQKQNDGQQQQQGQQSPAPSQAPDPTKKPQPRAANPAEKSTDKQYQNWSKDLKTNAPNKGIEKEKGQQQAKENAPSRSRDIER